MSQIKARNVDTETGTAHYRDTAASRVADREQGDTGGARGLVVSQDRAALSGLSASSRDPEPEQQGCSVVSLSQRFT